MKPIFSRNENIDKIAFLNWRISSDDSVINLLNMADGFMLSSIRLAQQCLINNGDKSADILIFPILTNINHGIELYLKSISWLLNILLKSEQRFERSHNLKQIFSGIKSQVKQWSGIDGLKKFLETTSELQTYITELFDRIKATLKTDNMDFSRYPFDKRYKNHFYVDMVGNVEIDLENFVLQFEKIRSSLESISDYLYYHEVNFEDQAP